MLYKCINCNISFLNCIRIALKVPPFPTSFVQLHLISRFSLFSYRYAGVLCEAPILRGLCETHRDFVHREGALHIQREGPLYTRTDIWIFFPPIFRGYFIKPLYRGDFEYTERGFEETLYSGNFAKPP